MSDGLKLDTAEVQRAGADLHVVSQEFADAVAHSDAAADAVGDPDLADTLRTFARSWDDARNSTLGSLGSLADACSAISTTFAQIDGELAAALD